MGRPVEYRRPGTFRRPVVLYAASYSLFERTASDLLECRAASGEPSPQVYSEHPRDVGQVEAPGSAAELRGRQVMGGAQRLVGGRHDEVLQHLDVVGVDGLGLNAHLLDLQRPGDDDGD